MSLPLPIHIILSGSASLAAIVTVGLWLLKWPRLPVDLRWVLVGLTAMVVLDMTGLAMFLTKTQNVWVFNAGSAIALTFYWPLVRWGRFGHQSTMLWITFIMAILAIVIGFTTGSMLTAIEAGRFLLAMYAIFRLGLTLAPFRGARIWMALLLAFSSASVAILHPIQAILEPAQAWAWAAVPVANVLGSLCGIWGSRKCF